MRSLPRPLFHAQPTVGVLLPICRLYASPAPDLAPKPVLNPHAGGSYDLILTCDPHHRRCCSTVHAAKCVVILVAGLTLFVPHPFFCESASCTLQSNV